MGRRWSRRPSLRSASAPGHQPIDEEDQDRADDRGEEAGALARPIPAQLLAEKAGDQGAGDAEQNRDQAAAGIAAGGDRLRDGAGEEADENPPEPIMGRKILRHKA